MRSLAAKVALTVVDLGEEVEADPAFLHADGGHAQDTAAMFALECFVASLADDRAVELFEDGAGMDFSRRARAEGEVPGAGDFVDAGSSGLGNGQEGLQGSGWVGTDVPESQTVVAERQAGFGGDAADLIDFPPEGAPQERIAVGTFDDHEFELDRIPTGLQRGQEGAGRGLREGAGAEGQELTPHQAHGGPAEETQPQCATAPTATNSRRPSAPIIAAPVHRTSLGEPPLSCGKAARPHHASNWKNGRGRTVVANKKPVNFDFSPAEASVGAWPIEDERFRENGWNLRESAAKEVR